VIDLKDRVLFTNANITRMPGGIQVQRSAHDCRSKRDANGTLSGSDSQYRQRIDDALVLRRQDHVHEDDREQDTPREFGESAFHLGPTPEILVE